MPLKAACSLIVSIAWVRTLVKYYRADRFAAFHQIKAFVNPIERQCMRDEIVDIKFTFHIPVDNLWHIGAAARTSKSRTSPYSSGYELKWACADRLAGH